MCFRLRGKREVRETINEGVCPTPSPRSSSCLCLRAEVGQPPSPQQGCPSAMRDRFTSQRWHLPGEPWTGFAWHFSQRQSSPPHSGRGNSMSCPQPGPPQDHLLHLDHVLRVGADQHGLPVGLGTEIAMRLRRLSVLPYFNMFPVIESRNAYTAAKSPNRAGRHRPHPRHWQALAKLVGVSLDVVRRSVQTTVQQQRRSRREGRTIFTVFEVKKGNSRFTQAA